MRIIKKLLAAAIAIIFFSMAAVGLWASLKSLYVPIMAIFVVTNVVADNTAGFLSLLGKGIIQLLFTAILFAPCYVACRFLFKKKSLTSDSNAMSGGDNPQETVQENTK